MILKAKERGDGWQLGHYLLRTDTNELVHVHELRGFVSDDLRGSEARQVPGFRPKGLS